MPEAIYREQQYDHRRLGSLPPLDAPSCEIKDRAEAEDSEVEGRKVVVEEELSLHEEEWQVMERPAEDEETTDFVVISHNSCWAMKCCQRVLKGLRHRKPRGWLLTIAEILVAPLLPQDQQPPSRQIQSNGQRASPPDHRVPDQVDLLVVLNPEILWYERPYQFKPRIRRSGPCPETLTIPLLSIGHDCGLESYACLSVKPALVCHITACSSRNLDTKPGLL